MGVHRFRTNFGRNRVGCGRSKKQRGYHVGGNCVYAPANTLRGQRFLALVVNRRALRPLLLIKLAYAQ